MADELRRAAELTVAAYDRMADAYFADTADRDRQGDYDLFFHYLEGEGPFDLLDLGCGPGRDLRYFAGLGHRAIGIDGSKKFVAMAKVHSGCPVQRQDLRKLRIPHEHFDGVFAIASLFHISPMELPRVLATTFASIKPGGVLLALNPSGQDEQGFIDDRFCVYYRLATWRKHLRAVGFVELAHGYRPRGVPRVRQEWITTVWRKPRRG